jgi:hypothetical protein
MSLCQINQSQTFIFKGILLFHKWKKDLSIPLLQRCLYTDFNKEFATFSPFLEGASFSWFKVI